MDEWTSRVSGIRDGHVHLRDADGEARMLAIRDATGIDTMAIVAYQDPFAASGLPEALAAKQHHPQTFYVFAGLNHACKLYPSEVGFPTLAEQVDTFVRAGCDGIKMIEGKPTARQEMNVPVTDPYYEDYWQRVEELGLPIVWHVNDPEEFWDPSCLPAWARERGWGYGSDDVQKEAVYAEVDKVLARHPALNVTFAHFYFLSADLPRADRFFDEHPNVRFDLAPGIEMLYNISRDPEAGRDFFIRHSKRIVFGTDLMSEHSVEEGRMRAGIVFRWLESADEFRVPDEADFLLGLPEDGIIRGLALPDGVLEDIYANNFTAAVGSEPNPLDAGAAAECCREIASVARAVKRDPKFRTPADVAADEFRTLS